MHAIVKTPPRVKSRVTTMPGKRADAQQEASALLFLSTMEGMWQQATEVLSSLRLLPDVSSVQSSFSTEGKANKYQPSSTGLLTTHTFQELPSRSSRSLLPTAQRASLKRCGQPLPCCFTAHSKKGVGGKPPQVDQSLPLVCH